MWKKCIYTSKHWKIESMNWSKSLMTKTTNKQLNDLFNVQKNKTMIKKIIIIILALQPLMLIAQDQQANLEKYWRYRERLRQYFLVTSPNVEEMGVNWPAMEYKSDYVFDGENY